MVRASARRPLPALIFLLALSLLTALVWWRVIHRVNADKPAAAAPACSTTPAVTVVPQPAAVTVTVLNSTQRSGLARDTSDTFRRLGFPVAGFDNDAPGTVVSGVAEIRYGAKAKAAATLMSFYLPGATLRQVDRTDSGVVVSLGARFTAVSSTAAARKAMAAAHVTQSAARPGALAQGPTSARPSSPASASRSGHC